MPRTKAQFEEMRQATKSRIQEAASYLFAQKGIAGTNVQEIADRAGISIGLLYRHYKTKEELFNDLVDMATAGLSELRNLFSSDGDPKEILTAVTNEIIDDYEKDEDFGNHMTFITQALTSGLQNDTLVKLVEEDKKLASALAALIRRGQDGGSFREGDPCELASAYMSMVEGIGLFQSAMRADFKVPSAHTLLSLFVIG